MRTITGTHRHFNHTSHIIIRIPIQQSFIKSRPRSHNPNNFSLHNSFPRRLRNLITHRDLLPGPRQLRQILIHRMKGDTTHRRLIRPVFPTSSQSNLQDPSRDKRILKKHLIKITHPKHQNTITVFLLYCLVLRHHWR